MRKLNIMIALLFCAITIAGCQKETQIDAKNISESSTIAASEMQTSPSEYSILDFPLPDGFVIDNKTDHSCAIVRNGEAVGELVVTQLDASCIDDPECDEVIAYLETYVAPPLGYEYMMNYWEGKQPYVDIAFKTLDFETDEGHDYRHYLFEKDSACYDLWFDFQLVDVEVGEQFLGAMGIIQNT